MKDLNVAIKELLKDLVVVLASLLRDRSADRKSSYMGMKITLHTANYVLSNT